MCVRNGCNKTVEMRIIFTYQEYVGFGDKLHVECTVVTGLRWDENDLLLG